MQKTSLTWTTTGKIGMIESIHSLNKEKEEYEIFHQRAFIFKDASHVDQRNPLLAFFKHLPSTNEPLMKFNQLHNMRYTFVTELFGEYLNV